MTEPARFDLDAYLQRIGHTGPRSATHDTLAALCALQPAHIAYENFDALLGQVPQLDPGSLQAKLVKQRRGGYCFEQNALLLLALHALGFEANALAARVVWMAPPGAPPRPRTHMLLRVHLPEGEFIADAGFGGHLLGAPLKLAPGLTQAQPLATLRLSEDRGQHVVETQLPTGWTPMYRFSGEAQQAVDFEPLNWFTATHPGSMFRHNLLLERLAPGRRIGLFNDRLVLRSAGEPPQTRRLHNATELAEVLGELFHLEPPVSAGQLFERIPRGLDAMFVPPPPA